MSDVIGALRARGFIEAVTDEAFAGLCQCEPVTVYNGFDPTATSLHIGHLIPIIGLKHFQLAGHCPIAVVGGGTGMIGDPSGKRSERLLLNLERVRECTDAIRLQLERFLDFTGPCAARVVNNADWLMKLSMIEYLRDVGKHFRVSDMLEKDSVRGRLDSEIGISYTEFSYMLLQSYDFLWLFQNMKCVAQAGGADQWGNITAGTDLIRKSLGERAYGLTYPLLLAPNGEKFGKSEGGSVWLDPALTSPYDFYQFWVRTEDSEVERLLKIFTFLPLEEIGAIMAQHRASPEKRHGQRQLARGVTTLVHGADETRRAEDAAVALFGGDMGDIRSQRLRETVPDAPTVTLSRAQLETGLAFGQLLVAAGLAASKSDARRLIDQGGAYLNNQRVDQLGFSVTPANLSSDSAMLLRAGKKNYRLVVFE